jgi:hypothetical protein
LKKSSGGLNARGNPEVSAESLQGGRRRASGTIEFFIVYITSSGITADFFDGLSPRIACLGCGTFFVKGLFGIYFFPDKVMCDGEAVAIWQEKWFLFGAEPCIIKRGCGILHELFLKKG